MVTPLNRCEYIISILEKFQRRASKIPIRLKDLLYEEILMGYYIIERYGVLHHWRNEGKDEI